MSTLGEKIRRLRKQRKLTQEALGAGLVTPSMISQIESDRATPSPRVLEQLALRLDIDPTEFADDVTLKSAETQAYRRAKTLMEAEQYGEALLLLESLTEMALPHIRQGSLQNDLAQCYEQVGRFDEATRTYEHVVQLALERDDVPTAVHAYYHLGHVYRKRDQVPVARMYWQRASELLRRHPDIAMPLALKIETNLARTYQILRLYPAALASYETAAVLANRYQSGLESAVIQHGMANAYIAMGEYAKADVRTRLALDLYEMIQHQRGVNQCRINLGVIARRRGMPDVAWGILTECMQNREIQQDTMRLAKAIGERAICQLALGRWTEAINDCLQVIEMHAEDRAFECLMKAVVAEAYLASARPVEAMHYAVEATEQLPHTADVGLRARVHHVRSQALQELGQWPDAVEAARDISRYMLNPQAI